MDSKKMLIGILSMFLVAMLITGCNNGPTGQVTNNADKPTITIGVSAGLTGGLADVGQSYANSAKLAIKDLPADTKYNYKIVIEDDKMDGKTAVSVMQKFMSVDNIDAVLSFSSGMGNIIGPIADNNKIIHCSMASDPTIAKGAYSFIHWTTPQEENRVMVKELQNRNVTKIGILALNQQGVQATVKDLKTRAPAAGISMDVVTYDPGETDFKTMLLKLQEKHPDYILLLMFSPEIEIAAKQYSELGMTIPLTSIETFEYSSQASKWFEGLWYVQGADGNSNFRDEYKAEYGNDFTLGGPNGYDCVGLIVKAFETASDGKTKPSPESVVKAFENIKDYPGAVGSLTVDSNHIVQSIAIVKMVKDGKFVTISSVAQSTTQPLQAKTNKPIKIGLSAPLTGEGVSFGQNELAGATLAVKELNDNGGINGRPVVLVAEDDQCGSTAVSIFNKLITADNVVGIIGPMCSAAAGPALPITTENNLPIIIFASAPKLVSIGDNIFRIYPSDALQGSAGADMMYNTLGVKKVAILYVENDWGQGIQKTFQDKYKSLGGEVVYMSGALITETDYKTVLAKIKDSGAEGLYLPAYPSQDLLILKQIKELGLDMPIVSGDVFATDEVIKSGYADGVIYTQGKTNIPEDFKQKINSLTGFENLNIDLMAPYGYDAVMVLAKAIEKSGTGKNEIIQALAQTHYRAVTQPVIEFDTDRELKNPTFEYMTVKDNQAVAYK